MTEPMRVDTGGLRSAAPGVRYLSSSLASTLTRLSAALDAEGSCWGRDHIGNTFAESYTPAALLVRDALPGVRDNVQGVGDAIVAVADNVDAAESRAQTRLS